MNTEAFFALAVDDTKTEEGFRPYLYDDANGEPIVPGYTVIGHPTIWHGLCVEKGRIPKIPDHIPSELLEYVLGDKFAALVASEPWIKDQPGDVKRALAGMAYQLGAAGVLKFRKMLEALKSGNRSLAASEALDSAWGTQTPARAGRTVSLIKGAQ